MGRLEGTDPSGSGINEQKVNAEGQALVQSTTQSEIEHESEENGLAFNWNSKKLDLAVGETILLIKNTSDKTLHIDLIKISNGATATEYTIHLPTTDVTVAGTTVTGTNLNTSKSEVADATAASNETGNAIGTSNELFSVFTIVNSVTPFLTPGLILGKNKSIAVDAITEPGTAAVAITGHFAD